MISRKCLLFLPMLAFAIVASGQAGKTAVNQEGARKTLEQKGLKYEEATFIEQVIGGDRETVKLYLDAGMSPNTKDAEGIPVLTFAIGKNRTDVALLLISAGADPKARVEDRSNLWIAALAGRSKIVEALLSAGALANEEVQGGHTVLLAATIGLALKNVRNFPEEIRDEIPTDMDIEKITAAPESEYERTIQGLLSANANVNPITDRGESPLMFAAAGGNPDIVRALVRRGAKINAQDRDGVTPLMMSVAGGNLDTVRLLLENGADVNAISKHGGSALIFAEAQKRKEIAALLRQAGARR
jgi:ankyrin repeat protein